MKRTITTMVLAASMMLLAIPAASATHVDDAKDHGFDESQDTAGADTGDQCRPGPQNNDLVDSWTLMTKGEFIDDVVERYDIITDPEDPEFDAERYQRLLNSAQATWTFCDKNRDLFLCVMTFNDVSPYGYTLLDNRPFRG
ncbi:MAG: hypothetical protein V3S26_04260 [Acidimicrobiia bacterium]